MGKDIVTGDEITSVAAPVPERGVLGALTLISPGPRRPLGDQGSAGGGFRPTVGSVPDGNLRALGPSAGRRARSRR